MKKIYDRLYSRFGPRQWWPGDTQLEVIVGAILTQNTSWANVEKAIDGLRKHGLLDFARLRDTSEGELRKHLKPTRFFNQKARYLRSFVSFIDEECSGDLSILFSQPMQELRTKLLRQKGIGPETADSILLYAGGLPIFVIDAYTRRIFSRLGLISPRASYADMQRFFMENLPPDTPLYNDYHAQIVQLGKAICKPRPECDACPLRDLPCPGAQNSSRKRNSPRRLRSE